MASHEAAVAAANLLNGDHHRGTPTVVFTLPPLAAVGLSEHQAREPGYRFQTRSDDTSGVLVAPGRVSDKRLGRAPHC